VAERDRRTGGHVVDARAAEGDAAGAGVGAADYTLLNQQSWLSQLDLNDCVGYMARAIGRAIGLVYLVGQKQPIGKWEIGDSYSK